MAKRGPKVKPLVLRELHGHPSHRPIPVDEPEGVGDLWDPPAYMDDEQRAQWTYTLDRAPPGLLTGTDRDIFACWVNACVEYQRAVIEVRKQGQVVRTNVITDKHGVKTGGNTVQNPYLGIMNRQAGLMRQLGAELGFSPAARSGLGGAAPAFGSRKRRGAGDDLEAYLALKPDNLPN